MKYKRKMKGSLLCITSSLIALLLISCNEEFPYDYIVNYGGQYPRGHPGARLADFPNTIGTEWVYATYDSVHQQADTVDITIIGSTSDSLGTLTTFLSIKSKTLTESGNVEYKHDTVTVFGGAGFSRMYIFPLIVGKSWGYDYGLGGDSVKVISLDSVSVPAGKFSHSFVLRERAYQVGPVAWYITQTWFVPKIGIIKMYTYGSSFR